MSFVHLYLLGGLVLVGLPIVIHLILQQKPKHLLFPAFRFLQQKVRTTQHKLRLRHLLLLLLRIALIALMCLALARPRLFNEALSVGENSPVAVVLLFDTSPSMEYSVNHRSRLEEAKAKARDLFDYLPPGSKVAVFDSADLGGEWAQSPQDGRDRVERLAIRPGNAPLTRQVSQAYRLLESASRDDNPDGEPMPRFLYVFSDRTAASWDDIEARSLAQPPTVQSVLIDVGVDQPADLAIGNLEVAPEVLAPDQRLEVRVTVRATGTDADTFVSCRVDEAGGEQKPVRLRAGTQEIVRFERKTDGLSPGTHRVEVKLGTSDSLPFNDVRFATFEIRSDRKVLVLTDEPDRAEWLCKSLVANGIFSCDVRQTREGATFDAGKLLTDYKAVCLLSVAEPDAGLWDLLAAYVQGGGKLAVAPGSRLNLDDYNLGAKLMPAKVVRLMETDDQEASLQLDWNVTGRPHPFLAKFLDWKQNGDIQFFRKGLEPRVARYWAVEAESGVIIRYDNKEHRPALVERQVGQGRVLLFTTGLEKHDADKIGRPYWNNYVPMFYLTLVNESMKYLVGDLERPSLNRICGETVTVELPLQPRNEQYFLDGPDVLNKELVRPADQSVVVAADAVAPGNYMVRNKRGLLVAGFTLNVKPDESLLDRVDPQKISTLFGPDAVVPADQPLDLRSLMTSHWKQPLELMPWLMIALLLVLAGENLLANKFYRGGTTRSLDDAPGAAEAPSRQWAFVGLLGRALIGAVYGFALGALVATIKVGLTSSGLLTMITWGLWVAPAGAVLEPLRGSRVGPILGVVAGGLGGAWLGAFAVAPLLNWDQSVAGLLAAALGCAVVCGGAGLWKGLRNRKEEPLAA